MWTGLWSNITSISDAVPSGHSARGCWASAKTRFHRGWKSMARNGRLDFQLLALVGPHRKISAVSSNIKHS